MNKSCNNIPNKIKYTLNVTRNLSLLWEPCDGLASQLACSASQYYAKNDDRETNLKRNKCKISNKAVRNRLIYDVFIIRGEEATLTRVPY